MYKALREKLENIRRLDALQQTHLLDSPPDESFDRLTRLAAQILNAPIALVSLVDDHRQFFKSCIGLPGIRETPLSHSFCKHVVESDLPLIVKDAREHPFLHDNPAVSELSVIAYAGIPIRTSEGQVLGSFCVIDTEPHGWTADEIEILTVLTHSVVMEIELGTRVREAMRRTLEIVSDTAPKQAMLQSALEHLITIERSSAMLETIQHSQNQFIEEGDARATFNDLLENLLTLTGSTYGFIGEVRHQAEGQPYLKMRAISTIAPDRADLALDEPQEQKGVEFFNLQALLEEMLATCERVIVNAPAEPGPEALPDGCAVMESFLGLPLCHGNEMVGMVGIANRPGGYDEALCAFLAPVLATCASLIAAYGVRRQRRQIQEALRVEHDFNTAVLETVGALVVVLDRAGAVVGLNRTCEEALGYSSGETVGKLLWETPFYPAADRDPSQHFWLDASVNRAPTERWWTARSGEERLIAWTSTALRAPDGIMSNMILCGMDITAQRANEIALAQARKNEVEIGSRIQQTLLHFKPPATLCGFSIGALARASQGIDGDYFDFFNCDMAHFDFLIGDVMGKGAAAALLGAASKSHFQRAIRRLQLITRDLGRPPYPTEILKAVHSVMTPELFRLDSFITLCYARFDPWNRCLTLIDCGHTRAIHYRAETGICSFLEGENLPLGVRKEETYAPLHIPIEPGDVLVFYSDGVTEAQNAQGQFFGEEGLLAAIRERIADGPQDLVEHIHACACAFHGSEEFADDFTCVAFRFDEGAKPPPVRRVAREFASSLEELEEIGRFLQEFCQEMIPAPLSDDITHLLTLGVHEAATNIICHAYAGRNDERLQIIAEYRPDSVTFYLYDGGLSFDPGAVSEPDFEGGQDHGFGMYIIRECMDEVHYDHDDLGRNCLTLVRRLV